MGRFNVRLIILCVLTLTLLVSSIMFSIILGLCCIHMNFGLFSIFQNTEEAAFYMKGAVATDNVYCSKVGATMLKENGTAMDAAIASCFCLGLVNMHSSGIGGGGVMVVYQKSRPTPNVVDVFDYREVAPIDIMKVVDSNERPNMTTGGYSIGVPGEIKGLYQAWQEYGKLPWSRLIQPTIDLAENGFPMHRRLFEATNFLKSFIVKDPGLSEILLTNGEVIGLGELVKNQKLGATLREISTNPHSFYNGSLAKAIIKDMKFVNGVMKEEDLETYRIKRSKPFEYEIKNGIKMYTAGMPFGGPLVAYILNILTGYNLTENAFSSEPSMSLTYHRMVEAMKFAFAKKTLFSDESFMEKDKLKEILDNLTSREYGESIRQKIVNTSQPFSYYHPTFEGFSDDHGTTHVSAFYNDTAVSVTSSINIWFGSAFRSMETGIIYNNQMDDFSLPNHTNSYNLRPSRANYIKPKKTPVSSMSPMILLNGSNVYMVIGGSGGTRIITATSSVILYKMFMKNTLEEAIFRPRVHHQLFPDYLVAEYKYPLPPHVLKSLKEEYKQKIRYTMIPEYSAVQAIFIDSQKRIYAKSDPRKYGQADGI